MFKLILIAPNFSLSKAFQTSFANLPYIEIVNNRFEWLAEYDCLVSPANSFGMMDGGMDAAIINFFGRGLEEKVQQRILDNYLGEQPSSNYDVVSLIVSELIALGVLFYILFRQKRNFKHIGLQTNKKSFRKSILRSIGLTLIIFVSSYLIYFIFYYLYYIITSKIFTIEDSVINFNQASLLVWLLFAVINPFFEELIVRAYLMSELED